ncbi:MAG: hypothetical protein EXS52_01555 [Candidatus Staskawiczbacteria bacterium]|nr:hypothetical protein [Candidatus Staskawiczbacteria bacterium]
MPKESKNFFKQYVLPVATLSSSIIGVGFLSLPYIALKVGIWAMVFYFIGLTALMMFLHIIVGKISLKTPDFKRWPGFVGYYLGNIPKEIMMVLIIFGVITVMLVYLIIGSQFLSVVVAPFLGGNILTYVVLYFAVASIFIYLGVKAISRVDFLALLLLLAILLLIVFKGLPYIKLQNLNIFPQESFKSSWFLPYGALLFSLWGAAFIPEVEEMVRGNKKSLKKIVVVSTLITAIFYFLFTFLILSITGNGTTESALVGLENFLGKGVMSIALCMGVITTFIAFIAEGLLLKKIFIYDLKVEHFPAFVFTCFSPLILFLLGVNSFIPLISFIGGVLLSIDGILILLMYKKIGGRNIVIYPLVIFFILGIAYELFYFL